MEKHANFIGGAWLPPQEARYYQRENPAHPDQVIGEFPASSVADVDAAVSSAQSALASWVSTPGPKRGALLFRFAELLEQSKQKLAQIVTVEQGKSLSESMGEVGRAAAEARYMAGEASRPFGQSYPSERPGIVCYTVTEPLGVVAAICPWNFPVVTPVRKMAPALAYGNTVVLKPASLTPWSSIFLMRLIEEAGFPKGVVNLVIGPGAAIGDALVSDRRVKGISFTGSTPIGTRLYSMAASRLAAVQLELGGKNPAVVIDYDDLQGAAREIVSAAFQCTGQRCTALSRVIVLESQASELVEMLVSEVGRIKVGDGMSAETTMGPLVSMGQLQSTAGYVTQAGKEGLAAITGGKPLVDDPAREGYYYAATVFDGVSPESPLAKEEIFGPVLPVIRVRDVDEAMSIANATHYGLAAALFSSRRDVISRFTANIDAGMIHINHGTASQAHVPFGGRKDSGQGAFSIGPTSREFFAQVKTIYAK
jgi:acyl-CoA reductase-like NAD-dependent aldehyde dehydrogenase